MCIQHGYVDARAVQEKLQKQKQYHDPNAAVLVAIQPKDEFTKKWKDTRKDQLKEELATREIPHDPKARVEEMKALLADYDRKKAADAKMVQPAPPPATPPAAPAPAPAAQEPVQKSGEEDSRMDVVSDSDDNDDEGDDDNDVEDDDDEDDDDDDDGSLFEAVARIVDHYHIPSL